MRLVRAGVVLRMRQRSARWREAALQYARERAYSVWPGAPVAGPASGAGGLGAILDSQNGERVIASSEGVTSGAATVLARRRRMAQGGGEDSPTGGSVGGGPQRQGVCKRRRLFTPADQCGSGDSGDERPVPSRRGRLDAGLVFSLRAREALESRVGRWQWRPRFGDG